MAELKYSFFAQLAEVLNSDQSRNVVLSGNVYDLFFNGQEYVPLIPFVSEKCRTTGLIRLVYELNGPIRVLDERETLKRAWITWKSGVDPDTLLVRGMQSRGPSEFDQLARQFDQLLTDAIGNPTLALEAFRQLTICSRSKLAGDLLILIEAADMLLPSGDGDISDLNDRQLQRIGIVHDWFSDPAFMNGGDSVVLFSESRSLIHPRVARLPQVINIDVEAPSAEQRRHFIAHYFEQAREKPQLWASQEELATYTAGLSIHALRQLLLRGSYTGRPLTPHDLIEKVEEFIQSQLGEDVVEFSKPAHTLDHVRGNRKLKTFLRRELIPRFRAAPDKALAGAAVAGPIGGGKTFIFEAMAAELGVPVLVLKSIRSQWYGQTDVIFERLRRVLQSLDKVVIFVDEADTQFGGIGQESHSTERRLTGKIQAMMSDPKLRGRIVWLLMTARIHLLSADIRRPGRVGDLIIPVLDPEGEDRQDFLRWVSEAVLEAPTEADVARLDELTPGYSAAAFSSLRSQLKAAGAHTMKQVTEIVQDLILPAIGPTRRYQTLQALVNCTRRSLLPDESVTEADREEWRREILQLELQGIR